MRGKLFFGTALFAVLLTMVQSCYYDNAEDLYPVDECAIDDEITFQSHIKPIVVEYCATPGCHVSGAQPPFMETYEEVKASMNRIRIRTVDEQSMPSSGDAPDCSELAEIEKWIDNGALDN